MQSATESNCKAYPASVGLALASGLVPLWKCYQIVAVHPLVDKL